MCFADRNTQNRVNRIVYLLNFRYNFQPNKAPSIIPPLIERKLLSFCEGLLYVEEGFLKRLFHIFQMFFIRS